MMGGPGAGAGRGPMMGGMGGGGRMGGGGMMNPAAAEYRLDGAKSALKITAEQESAWNAYAGVVKAQAETRAKFREQMAATDPGRPGGTAEQALRGQRRGGQGDRRGARRALRGPHARAEG